MSDIRQTLPSLEQAEQTLSNAVLAFRGITGCTIDDESEEALALAIVDTEKALSLVTWVRSQVQAVPVPTLPLSAEQVAFAPPMRHQMTAPAKLPPRKGDAFVDSLLKVAPSINTTAVRRAMLTPEVVVVALMPEKKLLVGMYDQQNTDGSDLFNIEEVPLPAGDNPVVSYRVEGGPTIGASRMVTAGMVLLPHQTAPMDLLPATTSMTLNAEAGPWCVVHMVLENGTKLVAACPPCTLKNLQSVPAWPIQILAMIAPAIYDEKRIVMAVVPKPNPQGMPKAFPGNRLVTLNTQMAALAARPIALTPDMAMELRDRKRLDALQQKPQRPPNQLDEIAELARRMEFEKREQLQREADNRTAKIKKGVFSFWAETKPKLLRDDEPEPEKKINPAVLRRQEEEAAARVVFSYWQDIMGKPRSIFDVRRQTRIITRLRENSGDVGELLYALDGAAKDDWLMGRDPQSNGKKYNDVHTIFRDREQVERLAETIKAYQRDEEHPVVKAMREGAKP